MIENPMGAAWLAPNAQLYSVIWQGITNETLVKFSGDIPVETAQSFCTEVVPAEYGHLTLPTDADSWGYMACGEEHNGDNPYDSIEVLFVLHGASIEVEIIQAKE